MICNGESITLKGSGGIAYSWSPATGLSDPDIAVPVATPGTSTQYQLWVSDGNCWDTASVDVTVLDQVTATAGPDTTICAGETVELFATANGTSLSAPKYSWVPNNDLEGAQTDNPLATPLTTTTYTVTVSVGLCQPASIPVTVQVNQPPVVQAGAEKTIISGMGVALKGVAVGYPPFRYLWTPGETIDCPTCLNTKASPTDNQTFVLAVTDSNGCTGYDSVLVDVIPSCGDELVYIPNSFTPNNDGINDYVMVRSYGVEAVNFFRVFDRWGNKLFETTDIDEGWDGYFGNELMPSGVYLVLVEGVCINGENFTKTGNVTLFR